MCSLLQKFKLNDREWGIFGPSPNFIKTEARHDFLGRLLAFFDNRDNALHIESILHKLITDTLTLDFKDYIFASQQIVRDLAKGLPLQFVECQIDQGLIGWKHHALEESVNDVEEMRMYIQKPFEVEEGVLLCTKCNSKRVFSYQKQTRGCDESSTTYAQCMKCNKKWSYSG